MPATSAGSAPCTRPPGPKQEPEFKVRYNTEAEANGRLLHNRLMRSRTSTSGISAATEEQIAGPPRSAEGRQEVRCGICFLHRLRPIRPHDGAAEVSGGPSATTLRFLRSICTAFSSWQPRSKRWAGDQKRECWRRGSNASHVAQAPTSSKDCSTEIRDRREQRKGLTGARPPAGCWARDSLDRHRCRVAHPVESGTGLSIRGSAPANDPARLARCSRLCATRPRHR